MMAYLLKDKFVESSPFTYCAVDMFGAFTVKFKQIDMKLYGAMFT